MMRLKIRHITAAALASVAALALTACTISYKFTGTVIDYNIVKSISITDFPNRAAMVYAPLAVTFNETLKDQFTRNTRLTLEQDGGDLELEGEITGYDIAATSVSSTNSLSPETKLTITINVRYTNNTNHEEDFEKTYTAFRTFDSSNLLTDVQDGLIEEIVKEICDNIFNDTVANW